MKTLLIPFLLLLPLPGWGQIFHIDPATHKIAYSEVTEVAGTSKEELFDRAQKWFDLQYAYAESVTMSEHEEEGELHIKAKFPLKVGLENNHASYTLVISVKDGKYRYLLTGFFFHHPNSKPMAFEHHRLHPRMRIYAKTDEKVQLIIALLHQKMIRKVTASVDEW